MVCITSTQSSLLVNSNPSEIFKPKRALGQGDPLSPLLCVIGMEYLSKILKVTGDNQQFSFHPRCKGLKLNHLCFADDLMLFCKGEAKYAKLLCESLAIFSAAFPLHANTFKSALYLAGIPKPVQLQIAYLLGLPLGKFPVKYLGMPLTRSAIKKVNAICRAYVWHADPNNTALGNINWNDICKPKKVGGLGIRNIDKWNKAALGKLAWDVANLFESLRVRWLHGVYTKGGN